MGYIFVIAAVTGSVTVVSPASPPKILPPCAFTFASVFPEKYLISRSNDLYEYLLSKVATAGTNGQFRTPRHIIKMMVELMKPNLNDVVCDPAMGSAGFIVESAKYVSENHENELLKKENLVLICL